MEVVITTSDAICQAISEVQETPVQTINQQCISVNLIPEAAGFTTPSKAFPGAAFLTQPIMIHKIIVMTFLATYLNFLTTLPSHTLIYAGIFLISTIRYERCLKITFYVDNL